MKYYIDKIKKSFQYFLNLRANIEEIKFNQGLILSKLNLKISSNDVNQYEFKVFSQWGEDGILQFITNNINIKNKTFIEFGIENFSESNCRFLMFKDNWSGFVIDGSEANIKDLKNSYYYWRYDLESVCKFIDADNINELLKKSNFDSDIGILSIDIDGNDYYVLEAINFYNPSIIVCEFNALFGLRPITVPYDKCFYRTKAHYSNLYFGASLSALTYLAKIKGYELVGATSNMGNAFFVRKDLLNDIVKAVSCEEIFMMSKERQSRDKNGKLSLIPTRERLNVIKGLPVYNVLTKEVETI